MDWNMAWPEGALKVRDVLVAVEWRPVLIAWISVVACGGAAIALTTARRLDLMLERQRKVRRVLHGIWRDRRRGVARPKP
jgi:hypothetical protein